MQIRVQNPEVWYAADPVVKVNRAVVSTLTTQASQNPRGCARLCAHRDADEALQEMIIVHARDMFVRPHKHLGKSESFHLIKGRVDVVLFDEMGTVTEVIPMGSYASGQTFYYRLADATFHTVLIRSPQAVFLEVTNGPFRREDTLFAPWAPIGDDARAMANYVARLKRLVKGLLTP